MVLLQAQDLYKFYHSGDEETQALRGVSLSLSQGEMLAVVGPSGSGKSTLIACLAGLAEPDGGMVTIAGERLTRRPDRVKAELRAAHLGIVLQSENLFDGLTVEENARLNMKLTGRGNENRLEQLLNAVALDHRKGTRADRLSGGERARAALVVALVTDPPILFADELTGEVDAQTEEDVLDLLTRRQSEGGASMIVTHSETVAARATRTIRLVDGRVADV